MVGQQQHAQRPAMRYYIDAETACRLLLRLPYDSAEAVMRRSIRSLCHFAYISAYAALQSQPSRFSPARPRFADSFPREVRGL